MSLIFDGVTYNVNATVKEEGQFLDKFAERTVDGILHREMIGVYFNWKMSIFQPSPAQLSDYNTLWAALTAAVEFHSVTVPNVSGFDYTYTAYVANTARTLVVTAGGSNYWKDTTVDFIAQSPAATP